MPQGDARPQALLFRDAAPEAGFRFQHFTGSVGEYFLTEIMGAGVVLFDYDSDGDLDVYALQGTLLDRSRDVPDARSPPSQERRPRNRLFRNELIPEGKLRFTDVTDGSGLGHEGYGMGAAVGDFDNDGDADLYVTNFGPNQLYRNNGDGTFTDITRVAGVDDTRWSTSAAFCDYDRDGNLDLVVANYVDFTTKSNKSCFDPTGARDYCNPIVYDPVPDRLFHNEGEGRFRDVSAAAGMSAVFGNGLGVICADWDRDGWLDIYVANDGTPNQLWRNKANGTFEDIGFMSGSAVNADGLPEAGMGVTSGDFDSDGDEDLFLTHLAKETNTLYLNDGKGLFRDATNLAGLGSISFPNTGFGSEWFDYDNDGWLDLFIANGAVTIVESLRGEPYPFHQKNQLLRNLEGQRFEDVSTSAGPVFDLSEVSRGAAFGDIDNDGDTDIVVTNNNGPLRLLLNEIGNRRNWLQIRLEGVESNRDGYGARVAFLRDSQEPLWRRAHTDGSYLSASDPQVHFGLGDADSPAAVGVVWPSRRRERWRDLATNTVHTLKEGSGEPWPATP